MSCDPGAQEITRVSELRGFEPLTSAAAARGDGSSAFKAGEGSKMPRRPSTIGSRAQSQRN
jgi:hypothetical protein